MNTNLFQKTNTQIQTMIPPFPLLKPAPTDLYTEIRERKTKIQIRISQISQYIEVKSEKILKEIQRFTKDF